MRIVAVYNHDAVVRSQSSAGGVFSLLAKEVIDSGGIVYGVGFDADWHVAHLRVDTETELYRLLGSKYAYSAIGSSLSHACKDLDEGRQVLFCGTPCQVSAMRQRAGNDRSNLLLVEVVCHGAPKPEFWDRYLSEICAKYHCSVDDIKSINFRDKHTGWKNYSFTIHFCNGKVFTQLHDDNLYMRAFLSDLTLREACFKCPFKYPGGSRADITLGDFWGISQLAPQIDNDEGTTIVIARSELGLKATSGLNGPEFQLHDVAHYNPAIVNAAHRPTLYDDFNRCAADSGNIIRTFSRFAGRPLLQTLYLKIARLKHKLLK